MKLKNYTSGVAVSKTIARIEEVLAEIGAKAIGKNYENGKVVSITFQLSIEGRDHLIRLPANPEAVYRTLRNDVKRPHQGTLDRIREQADKTAWKIQQDWLEVELSLIKLNQKEPLQAFLSYLWDGKQTYFEALKNGGFKQLPENTTSDD
jgi:hypothetical protein